MKKESKNETLIRLFKHGIVFKADEFSSVADAISSPEYQKAFSQLRRLDAEELETVAGMMDVSDDAEGAELLYGCDHLNDIAIDAQRYFRYEQKIATALRSIDAKYTEVQKAFPK